MGGSTASFAPPQFGGGPPSGRSAGQPGNGLGLTMISPITARNKVLPGSQSGKTPER